MDLSNYENEITIARESSTPQVKEIFDRSEQVINKLLRTKTIDNPLVNLPIVTFDLTKECVAILKEMEPHVAPTDNIYNLQAAKLFNIVNNIQAYWGKLYTAFIVNKSGIPDNESVSKMLDLLKASMLEITKLNLADDLKTELNDKLKNLGIHKTLNSTPSGSGCMVVIAVLIMSVTLLTLI